MLSAMKYPLQIVTLLSYGPFYSINDLLHVWLTSAAILKISYLRFPGSSRPPQKLAQFQATIFKRENKNKNKKYLQQQ